MRSSSRCRSSSASKRDRTGPTSSRSSSRDDPSPAFLAADQAGALDPVGHAFDRDGVALLLRRGKRGIEADRWTFLQVDLAGPAQHDEREAGFTEETVDPKAMLGAERVG